MTTPTPAPSPDPNATAGADENLENPAEGPNSQFSAQQLDQADQDETTQPPQPLNQSAPTDTDKGISG